MLPIVDDGQDALFGDAGNDWLVGGTNQDVLFGGWGNDVLHADDNLDSTLVTTLDGTTPTVANFCALASSYDGDVDGHGDTAGDLCASLTRILTPPAHGPHPTPDQIAQQIGDLGESITTNTGEAWTPDQATTLLRLLQIFSPQYDSRANDIPDSQGSGVTYADVAFGGAGYDVLIANTTADRLFDQHPDGWDAFYYPWEGGDAGVVVHIPGPPDHNAQFLLDLGLALGADPTRPDVLPVHPDADAYDVQSGEPFGELALINDDGDDFGLLDPPPHPGPPALWPWHAGDNPGLHLEGQPDSGRIDHDFTAGPGEPLGLITLLTPSAHPGSIEQIHQLSELDAALLNRIVVLGQLTSAEQSALSPLNQASLAHLVWLGLVALNGGVWQATNQTWLDLHLADAPTIDGPNATSTESAGITLSGTGDAGDTITVYDGAIVLGTTTVLSDGTWQVTVHPAVGRHTLTATQTVNELPHAGLPSAPSHSVSATVLPDAPAITFTSTPGAASPTAQVTISGTGDAGDRLTVFDGGRVIATGTVAADGTWSFVVSLGAGAHSLGATQTATGNFTSPLSAVAVTVYAPTPAPSGIVAPANVVAGSSFTLRGSGVAGDTVTVYDGAVQLGTTTVLPNGTWSLTVSLTATGTHALTALQLNPASGFWSNAVGFSVTAYVQPGPPAITSVSTPAPTPAKSPVTVGGTGVNGETITLYDGGTAIATVVVSGGFWSVTVNLTVGTHVLTATQMVATGVTSAPSGSASVTVPHK